MNQALISAVWSPVRDLVLAIVHAGVRSSEELQQKRSVVVINSLSLLTGMMVYVIGLYIYSRIHSSMILTGVLIEGSVFFLLILLNKYQLHTAANFGMLAIHCFSAIYFGALLGVILPLELVIAFLVVFLIGGSMIIFKERRSRIIALATTLVLLVALELNNYYQLIEPIPLNNDLVYLFRWLCIGGMLALIMTLMFFLLRENERLVSQLKKTDEAKRVFLREVCHELRAPMHTIQGLTQVLRTKIVQHPEMKVSAEDIEQFLQKVMKSTQYAESLVNNNLEMSKIEAGHPSPLKITRFHTYRWISEVKELLAPIAADKQIEIAISANRATLPTYLESDRVVLTQIMNNLLTNAIKHAPAKSEVRLSFHTNTIDRSLLIIIEDDGPGIPEHIQQHLFDPFVTGDSGIQSGTGLGMHIVWKLIGRLSGTIKVQSQPGCGTAFRIELPHIICEPNGHEEIPAQPAVTHAPFSDQKILVIDDDKMSHIMVSAFLRGCIILDAYDGTQGLEIAQRELPDVILLDARMPGLSGIETLGLLKKCTATANIPVIVASSDPFVETINEFLNGGAQIVLQKPLTTQALSESIKKMIKKANIGINSSNAIISQ